MQSEVRGTEHSTTLLSMNNLVAALGRGVFDEALLFEESLSCARTSR